MTEYKLTNFSIKEKPQIINAITYFKKKNFVAIGRETGLVEIYDSSQNFLPIVNITVSNKQSVDSLEFMQFNGKIQLVGVASSSLFVIDVDRCCIVEEEILSNDVCGRSVTQCADHIAVGCENGFIFLYEYNTELTLIKVIRDIEQCIFSLAWSSTHPNLLVAGSVGKLYRIDLTSSQIKYWDIGAETVSTHATVWCALFVNKQLITGDSRGIVTVWDPANFGILNTYKTHETDVLCLAEGRGCVHASGTSPLLVTIDLEKKVITNQRHGCDGDVRGMCVTEKSIVTAGSGGEMYLFEIVQRTVSVADKFVKVDREPMFECHTSAFSNSTVLFIYNKRRIEIHELVYDCRTNDRKPGRNYMTNVYARHRVHMETFAVDEDLKYLAYSTTAGTFIQRLYLSMNDQNNLVVMLARYNADSINAPVWPANNKCTGQGKECRLPPATLARFMKLDDQLYLILATSTQIDIYRMSNDRAEQPTLINTIVSCDDHLFDYIHKLEVSNAAHSIAFSTLDGKVFVYSLDQGTVIMKVARQIQIEGVSPIRAATMSFNNTGKRLVIMYTNREIYDVSISLQKNSVWCKKFNSNIPNDWMRNCNARNLITLAPNKFIMLVGKRVLVKMTMEKKLPDRTMPLFVAKKKVKDSKLHIIRKELHKLGLQLDRKRKIIANFEGKGKEKEIEEMKKKATKMEKKIMQLKESDGAETMGAGVTEDEKKDHCFTWYNSRENMIGLYHVPRDNILLTLSKEREDVDRMFYTKKKFGV